MSDLKADKAKVQVEQLQVDRIRTQQLLDNASQQLRDMQSERGNLVATRADLKQQLVVLTEKYEAEHQRFVQREQDLTKV